VNIVGTMFGDTKCPSCKETIEIDSNGGYCEKCNLKFWEDEEGKIHYKKLNNNSV